MEKKEKIKFNFGSKTSPSIVLKDSKNKKINPAEAMIVDDKPEKDNPLTGYSEQPKLPRVKLSNKEVCKKAR